MTVNTLRSQRSTPGTDSVKAKAAITWVGAADGVSAEVRLYDRLFTDPQPDAGGKNFLDAFNPFSLKVGRPTWSRHWPPRSRTRSSSLNATATSWPTAPTTAWAGQWCSTG